MKRGAVVIFTFVVSLGMAGIGMAQMGSNARGLAKLDLAGQTVSVDYGRPSLNGATIEAAMKRPLTPGHGFWRLGKNSSTTFKTTTALKFGAVTVPKGVYSLWLQRVGENSWKLVFNKQHGQWGTEHNSKLDFAFVPLNARKVSSSAPELVIHLTKSGSGGLFLVHWGDMELTTHFTTA